MKSLPLSRNSDTALRLEKEGKRSDLFPPWDICDGHLSLIDLIRNDPTS